MNKDTPSPRSELQTNPKVDLSDLTEAVMAAVRRAIEERQAPGGAPAFHNPRIIVGIILEPTFGSSQSLPALEE